MNNPIIKLQANGYSDEDILDLLSLFENQLNKFVINYQELTIEELSEELHRMKGGTDLLYLYEITEMISDLKKDVAESTSSEYLEEQLNEITELLIRELDKLRSSLMTS